MSAPAAPSASTSGWVTLFDNVALPVMALAGSLLFFGGFVWLGGASPVEAWVLLFKGAFGDAFSWQNTLQRAAPLMLTALCVALPQRAGLMVIGGEGALVLGGTASRYGRPAHASPPSTKAPSPPITISPAR